MSKRIFLVALLLLSAIGAAVYFASGPYRQRSPSRPTATEADEPSLQPLQAVCTGMVEAAGGEIDVFAQLAGELLEVPVREAETVKKGQILAVLDARRQEAEVSVAAASVGLAEAKLKRVQAGVGEEEKQEALLAAEAAAALLKYETANCSRLRTLYERKTISLDVLELSENQVDHLRKQTESLRKHYDSLRRGPLPEEIELARAEVAEAEAAPAPGQGQLRLPDGVRSHRREHIAGISARGRLRVAATNDSDPAHVRCQPPADSVGDRRSRCPPGEALVRRDLPSRRHRGGRGATGGQDADSRVRSQTLVQSRYECSYRHPHIGGALRDQRMQRPPAPWAADNCPPSSGG